MLVETINSGERAGVTEPTVLGPSPRVHVRIDAGKITTGDSTRDTHVRSADFLDVERFSYSDFISTGFTYRGGGKWTVQGGLRWLHGRRPHRRPSGLDVQAMRRTHDTPTPPE